MYSFALVNRAVGYLREFPFSATLARGQIENSKSKALCSSQPGYDSPISVQGQAECRGERLLQTVSVFVFSFFEISTAIELISSSYIVNGSSNMTGDF